jgi:hypothetical protein
MTELQEWDEAETKVDIPVADLDAATKEWYDARTDYDEKKKISNEADATAKTAQRKLVNLLENAGKSKWEVDGLCSVSKSTTFQITVPKDPRDKKEMLTYFATLGEDMFNHYVSVNSRTLNSYINQEIENNPSFVMPGVSAPTAKETIKMRKK